MNDALVFEVLGLPPLTIEDRRAASLVSEARSVMRKSKFARISNEGAKLAIEFSARMAFGFSDPAAIINGVTLALEQAGLFSRTSIRELRFTRNTGSETNYTISLSRI